MACAQSAPRQTLPAAGRLKIIGRLKSCNAVSRYWRSGGFDARKGGNRQPRPPVFHQTV
ncbi:MULTISPECIES: hypothetical protein [unclassified Neisseria]|uniref:hypothetical protein n=1 Tax=unclassified Neisseria TaxID=2623750 RepID=UPI00142FB541|nr:MULTISPECIES: hypothetical protein [unclassified Neisseria]MBF0804791.1 hypothetical protein [Neisseria sp. 19428wB4_WF04]